MKKLFSISICIMLFIGNLQSQDLIVTNIGDSINCKITKITKDYIHFTFVYNDEVKNTLLSVNQISAQQKDYFSTSELPSKNKHKVIFPRFRASFDGGWQYRTAKLASNLDPIIKEHYKKMKSGFHYDIQAAYFFTENMGVEVMFSQQFFENDLDDYILINEDGEIIGSGHFKEKISFNNIGANYIVRFLDSKKKNCWLLSIGFGYMTYNNRFFLYQNNILKITSDLLSFNLAIGYDIGISENFAVGFKFSLLGGFFRNFRLTANGITTKKTLPEKTAEGLGTVRLSVGLRFNN